MKKVSNPQTIYLVNNKKSEPDFDKAFTKVCRMNSCTYKSIRSLDCSYSYSRITGEVVIHHSNKPLPTKNSFWFIRAWSPSEDATALLCFILLSKKISFTDAKVNLSHEIRSSKLSQTFQLAHANCPSPSTWVLPITSTETTIIRSIRDLGLPIIIKTRGGLGKRVWKCNTRSEVFEQIAHLKEEGRDDLVIFQENIPNQGDIRIIVFKNKIIASISRKSTTGFLNNISQGGQAAKIAITPQERKLALKAVKVIGLDLAGVDIVRTPTGPLIFEVNKAPDICSFSQAAGINLAEEIAHHYVGSQSKETTN
jgi:RimK family alpha-L-glutamate ligase